MTSNFKYVLPHIFRLNVREYDGVNRDASFLKSAGLCGILDLQFVLINHSTLNFMRKNKLISPFHCFVFFVGLAFSWMTLFPVLYAEAQAPLNLIPAGQMLGLSPACMPAIVTGMNLYPHNPLQFDFIVNTGSDDLQGEALRKESKKLINYFLAALTVPESEMWVNLSPYEKNRIIADGLSRTEMGRDMLAQDYLLKQLTASLIYPEETIGREFWNKIYKKIQERGETVDIPVKTFNKVWIIPANASVAVNGNRVFVARSHLKVMLEEDYLALDHHEKGLDKYSQGSGLSADVKAILREIIVPEIQREVNYGKTFSHLRQIYNSMILATWYRKNLKNSLLGQIYAGRNIIDGIDLQDTKIKDKIYKQYLAAFEKGVYDYIKEEYDFFNQQTIPRKYFAGGLEGVSEVKMATDEDLALIVKREEDFHHAIVRWRGDVQRGSRGKHSDLQSPLLSKADDHNAMDDHAMLSHLPNGLKVEQTDGRFLHYRGIIPDPRIIRNYMTTLGYTQKIGRKIVPLVKKVYLPMTRVDYQQSALQRRVVLNPKGADILPMETVSMLTDASKNGLFDLVLLYTEEDYQRFARENGFDENDALSYLMSTSLIIFVSEWINGPNVLDFLESVTDEFQRKKVGQELGQTLGLLHQKGMIANDTHLGQFVIEEGSLLVYRIDLVNMYTVAEAFGNPKKQEVGAIISELVRFPEAFEAFKQSYSDMALLSENKGGIDFNPYHLDLRSEGSVFNFSIPKDLKNLLHANIKSIDPVIIDIIPVESFSLYSINSSLSFGKV